MSPLFGTRTGKPRARTGELLVEELGEELLVYDQRSDQVHCLGSAAWNVWRACDGETSVEQLGKTLNLDSELVDRALGELEACGLLDGEAASGVTRREATARLARMGAAAAAAPLIYSIAAPTPAMAGTIALCDTVGGQFACIGVDQTNNNANNVPGVPRLCNTCLDQTCGCCYTSYKACHSSWYRCTACTQATKCTGAWVTSAGGPCSGAAGCTNVKSTGC